MEKTAIVGWNGTPSASRAAEWLAERQLRNGRAMALVRVIAPADSVVSEPAAQDSEDEATRLRLAHRGLEVIVRVVEGEPLDVLRGLSSASNLVTVGRTGSAERGGLARPSLGERLASTARGPVAVVPDEARGPGSGIVVGVDGTEASLEALGFAAQEASDLGEPLEVVHAWLSPTGATHDARADRSAADLLRHRHESLLEESLQEVLADHPLLLIQRRVVQGLPVKVLLDEARAARMLVVGNHGRRLVARFLLGSVSNALLRSAGRATVVVKTAEAVPPDGPRTASVLAEPRPVDGRLSPSFHS
jgi:nucleotide-binding universal stress UspA family protein